MSDVYAFPSKRYVNIHTGVTRSMYFNVELGEYLQQKSTELIQAIPHLPAKFKIEFLRAFFDDEGCMDFRPSKKKRVRGYQKDTAILTLVHQLLSDINIASRIILPNEVVISGKENLLKFQKEINFSSGVRINGLRSNSIWKESLEKRELLRRAIASFKD
jgi:intein-encoded DNA endonuclease-like protein